jgi:hypothetical protein
MTMAKRRQLGAQEDDHDHKDGHEEATKNKKRTTMAMAMARKSVIRNTTR